jgi:hypothetical protein
MKGSHSGQTPEKKANDQMRLSDSYIYTALNHLSVMIILSILDD